MGKSCGWGYLRKGISYGEELTFDYNVDRYGAQAQPCYCGEANCIGFIGGKTQTEASIKLPENVLDALGVDEMDDWATTTARRKRKKDESEEDFVASLRPKPVTEAGVTTIMQVLLQNKEQWIISKLVTRIHMAEDAAIQRRVMNLHGYKILGAVLSDWKQDIVIAAMVLEILSQWPHLHETKYQARKLRGQ